MYSEAGKDMWTKMRECIPTAENLVLMISFGFQASSNSRITITGKVFWTYVSERKVSEADYVVKIPGRCNQRRPSCKNIIS